MAITMTSGPSKPGEPRQRAAVVIQLSFALATVAAICSCGTESEEVETPIRPVRYTQVFAAGSERIRTFAGTARAASEQNLSFRVGGTLTNVAVDIGSRVGRGQTLAWLDPSDYELRVQQSEASLAQARAQARNADASYERTLALYENKNASRSDVDAARAAFESANAAVTSAEMARRLAEQQVGYTRLVAPITGSVARVGAEANETVSPGQTIVVLSSAGPTEVEVSVPEAFIGGIESGAVVQVTFDAVPDTTFSATITEVGVTTTGAGTFPVIGRLNQEAPQVRPGMAAEVAFSIRGEARGGQNIVIVPSHAVGQDQQGRFVFALALGNDDTATVNRRLVQVGSLTAEGLEIVSGVADGEYVATAGLRSLTDGQQVRLIPDNR